VAFDPDGYLVEQVFFPGRDGTRLAAFLCRRSGVEFDGTAPCFQYGYGGFNISVTPRFSPANLVWLQMGGIYAQVTLRGGGEYGESWHKAGMRADKQNVFDDFMAASEWLVANRVTSRDRLAVEGRSNGGLLVGACLTQRRDLFGAAIAGVGVMDMLRFHKFTIGWAWQDEYGYPDKPEDFEVLRKYSPYHNVTPGEFPATMVMTGDHDDRVFPPHSYKFAAALQHAQQGPAPVLLRVDRRAGHGAGKPTAKLIDEAADRWAFLAAVFAVPVPGG
jgi:prolyl oligopeptidase